jgi:hypothetical protein
MKRFTRRPSPAMVVAGLALFVSLAGIGTAAVVIPRNSVGTAQLKTGAVTSTKVANGSLLRVDFKAGQAPAGPAGPPGPAGPAGAAGLAGPAGPAGAAGTGATLAYRTVTSGVAQSTSSTSFVDVPGATTTIEVPAGQTATIVARFSAETICTGPNGSWCSARIMIGGTEGDPSVGTDFAIDSPGTAPGSDWEGHTVARLRNSVAAGTVTVTVQYAVVSGATSIAVDDWALEVQAIKA